MAEPFIRILAVPSKDPASRTLSNIYVQLETPPMPTGDEVLAYLNAVIRVLQDPDPDPFDTHWF